MRTREWGLILAMGLAATATGAQAQGRRAPPGPAYVPPDAFAPYATDPRRGQNPYSVRRGYGGVITATTPNESGNFGGPSVGGGGGGR